jgi:hypothetical protein
MNDGGASFARRNQASDVMPNSADGRKRSVGVSPSMASQREIRGRPTGLAPHDS